MVLVIIEGGKCPVVGTKTLHPYQEPNGDLICSDLTTWDANSADVVGDRRKEKEGG